MAGGTRSFRLRYVGPRFEGGRLPLDVLSDLPAFRDLVVAFAKDTWRRQNAQRKRVPRGFERSIVFDLIAIEDGTAIPLMVFDRAAAQSVLPGFSDSFDDLIDEAYSELVRLFDDVSQNRFPSSLSPDHIRALNKFGAGLRNGDRIEFLDGAATAGPDVVYVDAHRRKDLITHLKETYETRYEGIGRLRANDEEGKITVVTDDHGDIELDVGKDAVLSTYDGNLGSNVQFDLLVELDQDDKFKSVAEIYHLDIVDEEIVAELERCRGRLSDLERRLHDGWYDGDGKQIAPSAIENATRLLSKKPTLSSHFCIYPTPEGGVLFEFESGGWDWSVECLPGGKVEFYGVEIGGKNEQEPQEFSAIDDTFMAEFEARVKEG
jgi:hypothetical protein